jgi:bis(5'-nucleosyl)-tetraphosphatase (symmetrical)
MATYAIGDVQGCFDELQALLTLIEFNPSSDQLWFAGDLVNRGPKSLQVLRFIKQLRNAIVVLGNHDIHLLSLANGHPFKDHTLYELLAAPDCYELADWLRQQPLMHYDAKLGYVMAHAGIFPRWSLTQAHRYAQEVEQVLRQDDYATWLDHLYGNQPDTWRDDLTGWDRLRFIVNAFTRMRFCTPAGQLEFTSAGEAGSAPDGYLPWFKIPNSSIGQVNIVYGHWAALAGETYTPHVFALDTGCAWGGSLTAMRLEDQQRFSVPAFVR